MVILLATIVLIPPQHPEMMLGVLTSWMFHNVTSIVVRSGNSTKLYKERNVLGMNVLFYGIIRYLLGEGIYVEYLEDKF